MNKTMRGFILVLAILYFLSPVDFASGVLLDDFVVLAVALSPYFAEKTKA